jgi:putative cell wall-binding protein
MTKVKESGKLIKLPQNRMSDLYLFLQSFPPNDLGSIGAMRKVQGALEQLEDVGKGYLVATENLNMRIRDFFEPFRAQLAEVNKLIGETADIDKEAIKKLEAKKVSIEFEANTGVSGYNTELKNLQENEGKKEVEVSLDPNYFTQVQELLKKEGMKKFTQVKAFLEICDALEIQE